VSLCATASRPRCWSQQPPAAAAPPIPRPAPQLQSCWAVIEGDVYDLTTWISAHPGGPDKISALCGTDATAQFTGKHGAVDDDGKPQTRLETFKLGPLQT
jgi:hypothetical protein